MGFKESVFYDASRTLSVWRLRCISLVENWDWRSEGW